MNSATILHGDCRTILETLGADTFDSVVTDPPYHLTEIPNGKGNGYVRSDLDRALRSKGFMGKEWDGGGVAFDPDTWRAVWRVLKPGGHMLVFGGTRTQHRMVCAIEDAGFEVRDTLCWLYASGFPKSHDVSKAIDRAAGVEREVVGNYAVTRDWSRDRSSTGDGVFSDRSGGGTTPSCATAVNITAPATPKAAQWSGWGTALKPAVEMICLARKPLSCRTVAANVLRHGTGALNVDGCRVSGAKEVPWGKPSDQRGSNYGMREPELTSDGRNPNVGRWPANLCHDGSPEVLAAFAQVGERVVNQPSRRTSEYADGGIYQHGLSTRNIQSYADTGSAARFFFSSKADAADRAGSSHPTVKPIDLMRWLVRLITPPGGHVLDPFAGSGTTAEACMLEGFEATLIEQDATHVQDILHRQQRWHGGDMPLFAAHAVADPADERQAELWRQPLAAD